MVRKFKTIEEWLEVCRGLVKQDKDNLIGFFGDEGEGKSTLAFQVMRALDPGFSADRVHFGIPSFLAQAPLLGGGAAILLDEANVSGRRAMYGETLDFEEFLKDCRALNLNMGLCFPHEDRLDKPIRDDRVRWKIEIPRTGLWVLHQRVKRKFRRRSGEVVSQIDWPEVGRWSFEENRGPLWVEYGRRKELHMRRLGEKYRERAEVAGGSGGLDPDHAVVHFRGLLGVYEEKRGPGASVYEAP